MKTEKFKSERGNSSVEVGLICGLIAVACVASTSVVGEKSGDVLGSIGYVLGIQDLEFRDTQGGMPNQNNGGNIGIEIDGGPTFTPSIPK
jgi:Flp pilus assembly pilin Flp